jgi:hypothetical protein
VTAQTKYLDSVRTGSHARASAALDQIGATVYWLIKRKYPEPAIKRRELYAFLQLVADEVIQPDLVQSK